LLLGTGCSLHFAGHGVSPYYITRAELAHLVLETPHRVPGALVVAALVHVGVDAAHVPAVGVAPIALRGRPPVAVEAGIVEIAIEVTVAAGQSRKSVRICTI
jgi:hypothetical protein